jgi:uncharacterized membrane protein
MVYGGNIGFQEMAEFYQKASKSEIKQMEKIIRAEDWPGFKKLIKRVLKVTLAEKAGSTGLESKRLTFIINDMGVRVFINSYLKDSEKTWLDTPEQTLAVETTIDLNKKEKSIYLNRMDASKHGKGYGRETLEFFLSYFKRKGFKTAKAYVEFSATDSANMLRKLKFKEGKGKDGRYFERKL